MPKSNSSVFEVALGRTTTHAGVTDSLALNHHAEIHTKPYSAGSAVPPIRRNLKSCRFQYGAAEFA